MAERPGFMIYFSDWQPLIDQGNAEAVFMFFSAAVEYARSGEVIYDFQGMDKVVWSLLQDKIDRDRDKYKEHILDQRYKGYRSAEGEKIRKRLLAQGKSKEEIEAEKEAQLLSKEEWLISRASNIDGYGRPQYD